MKKVFGCGMEVKLATPVDHHCMPVVCVLVIHLLVSFFELYCLSDVSSTQHYLPGKNVDMHLH